MLVVKSELPSDEDTMLKPDEEFETPWRELTGANGKPLTEWMCMLETHHRRAHILDFGSCPKWPSPPRLRRKRGASNETITELRLKKKQQQLAHKLMAVKKQMWGLGAEAEV